MRLYFQTLIAIIVMPLLKALLPLIQDNSLILLSLRPDYIVDDDDDYLEEAGRIIMANTSITTLHLENFREAGIAKYQSLFRGILQNQSITFVQVHRSDVCEGLPLFRCNDVSVLRCVECEITYDIFAAISQQNQHMDSLLIRNSSFMLAEDTKLTKGAKVETLRKEVYLKTLDFHSTSLGKYGFEAISRFLLNYNVKLETLHITGIPDEEWSFSFVNGLKGCKSLEILEYTDAAEQNLILLGTVALPHLALNHLDLSRSCIGTGAATALSYGISQNKTLDELKLGRLTQTTEVALAKIFTACLGPASMLTTLDLSNNSDISDAVMLSVMEPLANNTTLKVLILNQCKSVTSNGWLALSNAIGNSQSALKKLILWETAINNDAITAFANSLIDNDTLEVLDLSHCESVTPTGWRELSRVLGNPHSSLRILDVSMNSLTDDVVIAYANELSTSENSRLESLVLSDSYLITSAIWDPVRNLLCNTSSIDATLSSNHTLRDLGNFFFVEESHQDSDNSENSDTDEDEV